MKTFNHIVVPTDFSATARDALRMARALALGTRARVSIVHVVPDVWRQPWIAEAGGEVVGIQREWEKDAHDRLAALVAEETFGDAEVQTVVRIGAPHAEIAAYAESQHADLIVLGTHGHGPVHRFLLGSVAERLVRTARCPVLAVPHESLRATDPVTEASVPATVGAAVDDQC
jgi:nucleotide-binding universal stress UspA family protein